MSTIIKIKILESGEGVNISDPREGNILSITHHPVWDGPLEAYEQNPKFTIIKNEPESTEDTNKID